MGADLRQSCKQLYLQRHLEPKKDMLYSKGYLWRRSRQVCLNHGIRFCISRKPYLHTSHMKT
ncbi:unnamed protein product [Prunus armeniaca]|uniref:Uncharacterized protein n=1 Tax=Prunus armeniaca TaxID=36596 RepID=A0A6J5Y237_PRUAR|nr:unnamed protein product [Prunus armeniaca]CAB4317528.1 unnamed protein product [Prunus armeniaca]